MRTKIILRLLPAALLLVQAGLLAYGAAVHSPSIDEVGHMAAGLSHWQLGRFDLYHVNPPLVRMVAVVPVLFAEPKIDWSAYSDAPGARTEFPIGRQFITDNGERSFWFFTWARWACIPFSLLGGYVCFRWARELYGDWSGLLALTLWCFGPNILANGQLITPDMGATALGVTAGYLFWKWLKQPHWLLVPFVGLALGMAELTKTTWILLFALWPLLWLIWRTPDWWRLSLRSWLVQAAQLGLIFLIALTHINLAYGLEGTMTRLGDYRFVSKSLSGLTDNPSGQAANRFAGTWLGQLPVPLPANYLQGIDVQKHDFESHFNSYLCGEWAAHGWWYYYLFALTIKVPLGVWLLALLAAFLGLLRRGFAASWRDELTVLLPAFVMLAFVSSQTGFNHHFRYVLQILPFLFIWMSKAARAFERKERLATLFAAAATAWAVSSSLLVYPHSLSYFNELVGGPANGSLYLVNSNIDWGQDLLFLRDWLKDHPEAKPLQMAYFGNSDPRAVGIEFTLPPKGAANPEEAKGPHMGELGPRPGWYAVSVALVRGSAFSLPDGRGAFPWFPLNSFSYFGRFHPVAHAGWSIYIYHITPDECAKARREMGLPEGVQIQATPQN
jgi:4-amino-4-deoxy-L-arabinose transferase-like glycosyltransferase